MPTVSSADVSEERWSRILELEEENRRLKLEAQDACMLAGIYELERDQARAQNASLQKELIEASALMREIARTRRFRTASRLKTIHEALRDVEIHVTSMLELTKITEAEVVCVQPSPDAETAPRATTAGTASR